MAEWVMTMECLVCGWRGEMDDYDDHERSMVHTLAALRSAEKAAADARVMYEEARRGERP
jgi:hypothetical protein